jgi:hypothetical protein
MWRDQDSPLVQDRTIGRWWFDREHIDSGPSDRASSDSGNERVDIDHFAARGVDQERSRLHLRQGGGVDDLSCFWQQRDVEGEKVGYAQQCLEVDPAYAKLIEALDLEIGIVGNHVEAQAETFAG